MKNGRGGLRRGAGRLRPGAPPARLRRRDEADAVAVGEAGTAGGRLPLGQDGRPAGHLADAGRQRLPEEGGHPRHLRHRSPSGQGPPFASISSSTEQKKKNKKKYPYLYRLFFFPPFRLFRLRPLDRTVVVARSV